MASGHRDDDDDGRPVAFLQLVIPAAISKSTRLTQRQPHEQKSVDLQRIDIFDRTGLVVAPRPIDRGIVSRNKERRPTFALLQKSINLETGV